MSADALVYPSETVPYMYDAYIDPDIEMIGVSLREIMEATGFYFWELRADCPYPMLAGYEVR